MKRSIVIGLVFIFSLLVCFPAESVNRNAMLIKILNEVDELKVKSTQQEKKMDEILSIISERQDKNRKQIRAHDERSAKLLKDIRNLLQQLKDLEDD